MQFYEPNSAQASVLDGLVVSVIGYGNLGRSIALNLRDCGVTALIGNIDDDYRTTARDDGFDVTDISTATAAADVVLLLIPDEELADCFATEVSPVLRDGAAVVFASGYCLAYGLVEPPPTVDVLLIAPRMVGEKVRDAFVSGTGFITYISVEQDTTGNARAILLAIASASGCLLRGAFELPARDEALVDLFIEQSLGPVLGIAMQAAFEAGVREGCDPDALVLEMYMSGEMQQTFRSFAENGLLGSVLAHGFTAAYGGYLRTLDIDMPAMVDRFAAIAADIRTGGFARTLQAEQAQGSPTRVLIESIVDADDPMSTAERRVRGALRHPA